MCEIPQAHRLIVAASCPQYAAFAANSPNVKLSVSSHSSKTLQLTLTRGAWPHRDIMPVVEQRQGSPPGRQFRVKWTLEEGGDGTTFSSWIRPPTGSVRYKSSDLHELARKPLALLKKVDGRVLGALVECIDSPFEPGLTRSDSARDGASPSRSWATTAAAASPSRRTTAETWKVPELHWLIVASGWRVTDALLRQAVAGNAGLLAKLDEQLTAIGSWDKLYVPVSVGCAMAGLLPEPSPRTPTLSAVVAPEGAVTPTNLEALVQSAVAPLLQRLERQADHLESLRASGAAVAKQLRIERSLRRLHEKNPDSPPLGGGALKLEEGVPSELVETAQEMWGLTYDAADGGASVPVVADVVTLTSAEDIDMTELSLHEEQHRDALVAALGPFFSMNDLELKLLSGVSVSAKQLVADFRDRERRWTMLHASLFTLATMVYHAADSADEDTGGAAAAVDSDLLPQQLESALQLAQQTLALSVQMRAHDHSALRKKLEKSSGVAQEARDALAALRTARVDTHVHRGLIGEADLTDMVKAMELSEAIAKDLSGKKGSAASAKQADALKAKKARMADAASRKKFFAGGKGSGAKGKGQQQQQQSKQQQQQQRQQQRTPDRQDQRAPATPANGGGDRGASGAAGRR